MSGIEKQTRSFSLQNLTSDLSATRVILRTENGREEPTGLPVSNVLYFELEKGNWVCVRPSGTEPKIKLYVNSNAQEKQAAEALNAALCEASKALMA